MNRGVSRTRCARDLDPFFPLLAHCRLEVRFTIGFNLEGALSGQDGADDLRRRDADAFLGASAMARKFQWRTIRTPQTERLRVMQGLGAGRINHI